MRLGLAVGILVGLVGACNSGSDDVAGGATDAGFDAAAAGDSGVDAGPCTTANPIAAPFAASPWVSDGIIAPSNGIAVLTEAEADRSGSIAWPEAHSLEAFDASFELRIKGASPMGEGLVFVWTPAEPPATGAPAANMGACPLGGYGVAFDTAPDDGGAGVQLKVIRLEVLNGCPDKPIATTMLGASLADGAFHPVRVELSSAVVTVTVDGAKALTASLTGYAPFDGYVGFTAATGTRFAEHSVRAPRIGFPLEPGCP